jgi:hypothetical protein
VHSTESTRGRMMALYGLINRGLGPVGAFPIGIIATQIGAPITIALGGTAAIAAAAYLTLRPSALREADMLGEKRPSAKQVEAG